MTTTNAKLAEQLTEYARMTAADTGESYDTAVRHMRDEPSEVAAELGCTAEQVIAWTEAQS